MQSSQSFGANLGPYCRPIALGLCVLGILVLPLSKRCQGAQPDLMPVPESPNHGEDGKHSQENWRDNQDLRGRQPINENEPDHQFTHKYKSPDHRNQPMAETHFRKLPRGVESSLPFRIRTCNEM